MEALRLSQDYSLACANSIPILLMRLGKDQEAYDFIQWCAGHKADFPKPTVTPHYSKYF